MRRPRIPRSIGSAGALAVSDAIGRLALLLAAILLSRELGPTRFGELSIAFAVLTYVSVGTDFGTSVLGIRAVAQEPWTARATLRTTARLRFRLAVAAGLTGLLFGLALPGLSWDTRVLVVLAAIGGAAATTLASDWLFIGLGRYASAGFYRAAVGASFLFVAAILVDRGTIAVVVGRVSTLGAIGALSFALAWLATSSHPRLVSNSPRAFRTVVPFGVASLAALAFNTLDVFVLAAFRPEAAVGEYRVAYAVILGILGVSYVATTVMYKYLAHEYVTRDLRDFLASWNRLLLLGTTIAGLAAIAIALAAPWLIPALVGRDYDPAIHLLQLLSPVILLDFVVSALGVGMNAAGQERLTAKAATVGVLCNLGMNLSVIPKYGAAGAAVVSSVTYVAMAAYLFWVRRRIHAGTYAELVAR